jgi:hypothetical protein
MRRLFSVLVVAALAFSAGLTSFAQTKPISLFNGKDLAGWVNVNTGPDTWSVRDGVLVYSQAGALPAPSVASLTPIM